ncbi:hypothetical protein I316_06200 [Kwoniella heveanensis BCC8398]|uniref:Protein kinase domain-containing protein n=1 Tax=Kwoniella heveanensis BCC8398 TaxID=1296120 RepID=A0A1B9GLS0_9TREE|nr:hypothetical protein I316_06200 [Kwoniella heveanensis BCC8398]
MTSLTRSFPGPTPSRPIEGERSEYDYTWLEDKGWTPDLSFGQAARNSSCLVATSGRYIDYGHLWDAFEGLLYVPPPDDTPTATPRPITPTPVQPILVLLKFADPDGLVVPEDSYGFDEGETIRGITNEMQMYVSHLADLCGRELPRFYGLWTGQWNVYMMILERLGDCISDRDVDKAYDEGYDPEKDEDTWTDLPEGQRSGQAITLNTDSINSNSAVWSVFLIPFSLYSYRVLPIRLPDENALLYSSVQIAKLFNALHARGVVHRDVSLRNIRKRLVVSSPSSDPVSVPPLLSSSASSSTDAITTTTIDDSQTQTQTRTTDFPWVLTNMDRARKVTVNGPSVRKERRKLGRLLGFPRY